MSIKSILSIITCILVCFPYCSGYADTEIVNIPDPNLDRAVRNMLGLSPGNLTTTDMQGLTKLVTASVADLTGLEAAVNLKTLKLLFPPEGGVSGLDSIAGLVSLEILGLAKNNISDLSPLAGLVNLRELRLQGNAIEDLSPLTGLVNLRELNLEENPIEDLGPLAGMVHLEFLELKNNLVSDLEPLSGLESLYYLEVSDNLVVDLSPLSGLTNLRHLYLWGNQIQDLSPLVGLVNLNNLVLFDNQIREISPLLTLDENSTGYLLSIDLGANYLDLLPGSPTRRILHQLELVPNRRIELFVQFTDVSWGGYYVSEYEGIAHTRDFLGDVWIVDAPWIKSALIPCWLYMEEPAPDAPGAWGYFYK